ncbi:hypothetical protein IQ07DRAFT_365029 [Pyrenochaeta sp. DS3sAY3a]|nr:hypothetical protein IQ07DRAFT_365029 [Pyrenochaeta sp. DS3sAY3a]
MGGNRGPRKFSFPLPRRSRAKVEQDDDADTRSVPSIPERPVRRDDNSTSKAHRVLGTSDTIYRAPSNQPSVPASPGYMSITVSEASFGSQFDDRRSTAATEHTAYPKRPGMSKRPSSNILGNAYSGDDRRGSDISSISHRLQPQTSNSTMRSHYDAKNSPLFISQQTSDSAVRDRALRRGQPPVITDYGHSAYVASPISPEFEGGKKKDNRKSKPARLDLSKLFPKPKAGEQQPFGNALLSPTKMVNSPAAMSMASDYFPRPMTREPTPQIGGHVKLKTTTRHQVPTTQRPASPVRKFQRDEYDNAKVHVRRPPKGVQHWFDALDDDSDEASDNSRAPIHAPTAVRPNGIPKVPIRKTSLNRLKASAAPQERHSQYLSPALRKDTFSHEDLVDVDRLTSPSQFSVATQNSLVSTKTKESALSKSNLQDSSVLSFSSSEEDHEEAQAPARKFKVRKSLDNSDDAGDVIVGQARAYEVRPTRRPSAGKVSMRSISTNAATIEVMYTPEPPFPSYHYPRSSTYSGSRRSSHVRQPSVIPEDEDFRPKTATNLPLSPTAYSIRSTRTSASEPQPQTNGSHKMMAVTAEEEALLELMRKKRAAMAKQSSPQADGGADEEAREKTPTENSRRQYRTSAFLSMEASPVRAVDNKTSRRASAITPSPLLLPPTTRGRPLRAVHESHNGISHIRDSSNSDTWSDSHTSLASRSGIPHQLPTPGEFSPLDLFPPSSPTPTASVASPSTTGRASPLPSPLTPGLRMGEADLAVKVANSDTSNETEDLSLLDNGVLGAPSNSLSAKSAASHDLATHHQRRRTASSGADMTFPTPPATTSLRDLAAVAEAPSRPSSMLYGDVSSVPRRSSKRVSELSLSTNPSMNMPTNRSRSQRSRQSSVHSNHSQNSNHSRHSRISQTSSSGFGVGMGEKRGPAKKRSSVSDDVLAAWNSLGGTY